jgi:hypothetical protein
MTYRKARIAVSVVCGVCALLLCVLWARSYARVDVVSMPLTRLKQVGIWSGGGRIEAYLSENVATQPAWQFTSLPRSEMLKQVTASGKKVDRSFFGVTDAGVRFSTYLLVLMAALFGALPWIRCRFTLRTLLVAVTVVGVGLGAIIALSR